MALAPKVTFSLWAALFVALTLLMQFVSHRRYRQHRKDITCWRLFRALLATFNALILAMSSYFHARFGEGRARAIPAYSFEWYTDTYEVTVMTHLAAYFLFYLLLAERPSFGIVLANAVYVGYGALWTTQNIDDSTLTISAFNWMGVLLGVACAYDIATAKYALRPTKGAQGEQEEEKTIELTKG